MLHAAITGSYFFTHGTVLVDAEADGGDQDYLASKNGRNRNRKPVSHPGFAPADKPGP